MSSKQTWPRDEDHRGSPAEDIASPSDNTTMVEVIQYYRAAGFDEDLYVEDGGAFRCGACDASFAAAEAAVHSVRRLEGASDPDDMAGVVALTCPVCGAGGTTVLKFGPGATPGEAEVWGALRARHDDGEVPAAMAPGEDDVDICVDVPASPPAGT